MKPMLKYTGGKQKEIPCFLEHIPEKFDTYIEPFMGGGAVFFHLEPAKAILNDKNKKLIDFYLDVRNIDRVMDFLHQAGVEYSGIYQMQQNGYRKII